MNSIKSKILISTSLCLLATTVAIIAYTSLNIRSLAISAAESEARILSQREAARVKAMLEVPLDEVRSLAKALAGLMAGRNGGWIDRDQAAGMLKRVLAESQDFQAMFTLWEPGGFDSRDRELAGRAPYDKTGRFMALWQRDADNQLVRLPLSGYDDPQTGKFYLAPKKDLREYISEPTLVDREGLKTWVVRLTVPVIINGLFRGVVGAELNLHSIQQAIDTSNLIWTTARLIIISRGGTVAGMAGHGEAIGRSAKEFLPGSGKKSPKTKPGQADLQTQAAGQGEDLEIIEPIVIGHTKDNWAVGFLVGMDAVIGRADVLAQRTILISLGFLALALTLLWFLAGKLAGPITSLTAVVRRISGGDLSARAEAKGGEEMMVLAESFNSMVDELQLALDETKELIEYLNRIPAPVIAVDTDLRIKFINPAGAEKIGLELEEVKGAHCRELFKSEHCGTDRCGAGRAMATGRSCTDSTRLIALGGLPIQFTASPLFNTEGEIVGALEYMADISEQKKIEEKITQDNDQLQAAISDYLDFAKRIGQGDLTVRLKTDSHSAVGLLGDGLNKMADQLREFTAELGRAISEITSMTTELLAASSQQAATSSQQAAAITETSTTVLEVRETTEQAADRVKLVSKEADQSAGLAGEGIEAVDGTREGIIQVKEQVTLIAESILGLSERTQQIGKIISTVNDIADQSNLLALNASIEAARAGEAGEGFAVVADEVRALADQSRNATAQVKDILGEIQKAANRAVMVTEEGTKRAETGVILADQAGASISDIADRVAKVAQAAVQITASAKEQLIGVEQIANAMEVIDQATHQTQAGSRQVEGAAGNLNKLIGKLDELLNRYRVT